MARKQKFMSQGDVVEMAMTYFPSFLRSRQTAIRLDAWQNGRHFDLEDLDGAGIDEGDREWGVTYTPKAETTTGEYDNLQEIAPNNFAGLVVVSLAQTAYIEGISRPGLTTDLPSWLSFRRNGWMSLQSSIHRTAIGQAQAYGIVVPGTDPLTGGKASKWMTRSPKRMAAFYDTDDDEWPRLAIEADVRYESGALGNNMPVGWTVSIYDSYVTHRLTCKGDGQTKEQWDYITFDEHGIPVCPVARLANRIDLDGRATGEIEPVLPLLRRIDQDVFDRLIVQRFGAWQVRYIAGMAKPAKQSDEKLQAMQLRVQDLLVSTNEKTQFGVLPASPLEPHIQATDADLRLLAAVTQTPPHHLLGLSSNLQAEALAAAESGLQRKSYDFRQNAGRFYEQMARLDAMVVGDMATAAAFDLQVRWRDTESRSQAQAAQALGILATQLKVPLEMLWEKVPGWTDDDVKRAKQLVEDGTFEKMVQTLLEESDPPEEQTGGPGGDDGQ